MPDDDLRALFEDLDTAQRSASEAMESGDMQGWVEHAGRGAELFEVLAQRFGWRDDAPMEPR